MKQRQKEITIGETTFVVHTIPPFQALAVLGDLQKELAPVLGALAEGEGQSVDFAKVAEVLSPRLSGEALLKWTEKLLRPEYVSVVINGNAVGIDKETRELAFTDALQILQLMYELIAFNFAEPLRSFGSRFGPQVAALTKASK